MSSSNQNFDALQLGSGLAELGSGRISTTPFVCDEFFEREKEIWKKCWLMVGLERDLQEPGQYLTFDLKVLKMPLTVIRGRDGRLFAFENVCRHRGSRLLWDRHGQVGAVVCRFHGWTYGLDGKLRGVPEQQLFDCLDRDRLQLQSIAVDTWGGFVFINLNPAPAISLQDYLSGLPANLNRYLSDQPWRWYTGYQVGLRANWKDLMNIQHEGYHASYVHKKTLAAQFRPDDCRNTIFPESPGVCSLLTVQRPVISEELQARMTTVQKLAMKYGTTSNWVDQDTSSAAEYYPGAVNHAHSERWVFDCWTLFPNLLLFVGTDVLMIMRMWPVTAHEADWEVDWFFKDELKNFGNLFNREHGRLATRNALTEDWPVCEWAHRNLCAGIMDGTLIGSDMEATVRAHYQKLLMHMGIEEEELPNVDARL